MSLISIVVPCYNEGEALPEFIKVIRQVRNELHTDEVEVIFVNDGSSDSTLEMLRAFHTEEPSFRYVSFSRNFGKESAILAGLKCAKGDYVAVMDADLQDPPDKLPEMLRIIQGGGIDCVGMRRVTRRGEPPIRSLFARLFYRLINMVSEIKLVDGARDYKLLSRKVVDALLSMPEYHRFSKGLYEWVGFRTQWMEYENIERVAGSTKWSFWKLFKYALEGILSFTTAPLALASMLGIIFMGIALSAIVALCVRQIVWQSSVDGWTSTVCIILLLSGVQLFCLGIFGQYLAKMYMEVKHRPHYIVSETSDNKHDKKSS